jgi:hypothetical protein
VFCQGLNTLRMSKTNDLKLALALQYEGLPGHVDAKLMVACHDELVVEHVACLATGFEGQGSSGNGCQDLDRNVGRSVRPVSSTAGTPALRATRANCGMA